MRCSNSRIKNSLLMQMSLNYLVDLMVLSILLKWTSLVILEREQIQQVPNLVLDIVMLSVLMISNGQGGKLMFKDGHKVQLKELLVLAVLNWTFGKLTKFLKPILFILAIRKVNSHAQAINVEMLKNVIWVSVIRMAVILMLSVQVLRISTVLDHNSKLIPPDLSQWSLNSSLPMELITQIQLMFVGNSFKMVKLLNILNHNFKVRPNNFHQ